MSSKSVFEFAVTSDVESAANACRLAMQSYVNRGSDVMPQLKIASTEDDNCALAPALLGLMLHGARNSGFTKKKLASYEQALQLQKAAPNGLTEREDLYISALGDAVAGNLDGMVSQLSAITEHHPDDVFAIALAQGELFWMGQLSKSLEISERVRDHWHQGVPGYAAYLGCRAFDLEEAGRFKEAENCGRESVDIDPQSIWAAHAVAHVLYMQGRFREGVEWLESQEMNWDECNQIKFHVWWHKCLFQLDSGEHDSILETYDKHIRNREHELTQSMPDLYIDMQNGASLLWRLEQAGIDVGDRWQEMAELAAQRLDDLTSPFTSAHFAVILAAVGDYASCDKLIANMTDYVKSDDNRTDSLYESFALAALPSAIGALAHRKGDYKKAESVFSAARSDLWRMGGSHAQQDVFFQMLFDATLKTKQTDAANTLLREIEHIGFFKPDTRIGYAIQS